MTVSTEHKTVTPFAGWVRNDKGLLAPLETAPHIGGFAPPGTGKTRRWLAQSAVLWPSQALVSSSKDDLMQYAASLRYGPNKLLDLRPIRTPWYGSDIQQVRYDPTMAIASLEDALALANTLLSISTIASRGSFNMATNARPWDSLAFAPLTSLLFAASPACTGMGMEWVLEAAENADLPLAREPDQGMQMSTTPSWASAAAWASSTAVPDSVAGRIFAVRVASVLEMEPKQKDSVKIQITDVLTPWLVTLLRDRKLPPLDLTFLDHHGATLYLLSPDDGSQAGQAIALMDQLIERQRAKTAEWQERSRLGMFLDELTNTPLPRLPRYLAETRGLGVTICYAVQDGAQIDAVYGPLQGRAIRNVTPATLVMYGSYEEDILKHASFMSGPTTRSHVNYGHNGDDKSTHRVFGNVFEPQELVPRNYDQARLIVRGTSGRMVDLIDWSEFVPYLRQLRTARIL